MSAFVPTRSSYYSMSGVTGASHASLEIGEKLSTLRKEIQDKTSEGFRRNGLLQDLVEVYKDALEENWDAQGSDAINARTFVWAHRLIVAMPAHFPVPDVLAHPDGDIAFEWQKDGQHVFSLSIDERGIIHYSGLFGPNSTHGRLQFADELPDEIGRQIERHLSEDD